MGTPPRFLPTTMQLKRALGIVAPLLAAGTLTAQTTLDSDDQGWYSSVGFHDPTNPNYICGFDSAQTTAYRNWFVFDPSVVGQRIAGATLLLFQPVTGFDSMNATEQFSVYEMTTPLSSLLDGTAGVAAYTDMGDGILFGSVVVTEADEGTTIAIDVTAEGIAALDAAGGPIAFGGALDTLSQSGQDEFVFGSSAPFVAQLEVNADPSAFFSVTPVQGFAPLDVTFSDLSLGTGIGQWSWDFGDGSTSSLQNPTHQYTQPGTYTVSLTVDGSLGSDTLAWEDRVVVLNDPTAAFSARPTQGLVPLDVAFEDQSLGAGLSAWSWDFGDGGTSTETDPTHVYVWPGTYPVQLTVTGSNGSDTTLVDAFVLAENGGVARQRSRNGSGTNPVLFTTTDLPVLGTTFDVEIDAGSVGSSGLTFVIGYSAPLAGLPTGVGELLIDVTADFQVLDATVAIGGTASHALAIPNDLALLDLFVYTQGFVNNPATLTNALDLVLGF